MQPRKGATVRPGRDAVRVELERERQRLAAVDRYEILDSPPDGAFDRISAIAARLFGVPIGIVSIVDRDRIWFKAHHGLDVGQIDRDEGLCASAIRQNEPWLVTDAQTDPRTLANPLVAGEFGLRFYAGAPLRTHDGHNLGTLCVLGKEPRDVTEAEMTSLGDLAAIVMDELELRLVARKAVDHQNELRRDAEDKANSLLARYSAAESAAQELLSCRSRVASALIGNEMEMVFQPILALDSGRVVGVEGLARFPGTDRGPDEWFADAASVGLGIELELAAMRAAVLQIEHLAPGAYLAINCSPAAISSAELRDLLLAAPTDRIVLELTEHAFVPNYKELSDTLAPLRAAGLRIAVDDAGAGFASLQHILGLKPDIIKLDMSLTRGIDADPARRALATALLTFGSDIGAEIVAEGIETAAELEALRVLGIQSGQGYYLGRPVSPLQARAGFEPRPKTRLRRLV